VSLKYTADEAKAKIIELVSTGMAINKACEIVEKDYKTYEYYRKTDENFRKEIEAAKDVAKRATGKLPAVEVPPFPEFCEKYLGIQLSEHQLQWYDILENRDPRNLHPAMTYIKGLPNRFIINTPPGHAKSETVTVLWTIYTIVKDPSSKNVIVSKTQNLAKKFLLRIKTILTDNRYRDLQRDFAPDGDWKKDSASWTATQIYVGGRAVEDKDPTVQAIGIRAQLYGNRADNIILDDCIDNTNHRQYEEQREWIQEIVSSRLTPKGKILVIGTRIATRDLYSELQDPEYYFNGTSPYTYLVQPAVLEYAEDPIDWKTLWAKSNIAWDSSQEPDENGLYVRWGGEQLSDIRNRLTASGWSRIYMQQQIAEENPFKEKLIKEATSGRAAGLIPDNPIAGRAGGMNGLFIVAGVDPATSGYTSIVVLGVDTVTGIRYIIDVWNNANTAPHQLKNKIKEWHLKYRIKEWRIEENGFQGFLANDIELRQWVSSNGGVITPHRTGNNKHDSEFGVMAMTGLFEAGLISLPSARDNESIKALVTQLLMWEPNNKKIKTDCVMALWFAELRAQEVVRRKNAEHSFRAPSKFASRSDLRNRRIIGFDVEENPYDLKNYSPFGRRI